MSHDGPLDMGDLYDKIVAPDDRVNTPVVGCGAPPSPSPGSHAQAQALRDFADALSHVWGDDPIPAPLVYRALRDRADSIERT